MEPELLSGLPEAERGRVAGLMVRRYFSRGETLFHEGDPADCVHFVRSGRFAVRIVTGPDTPPDGAGVGVGGVELGGGVEDPEDPPEPLELFALLFEFPLPELPPLAFARF